MKKKNTFKLIDGEFNPSDARNILFTLINSKINFHSMESFGITVRTSGDTSFHKNRIKELTQTNVDIRKLMDFADEKKVSLKINGLIEIEVIDDRTSNGENIQGQENNYRHKT
jgi:hypothetical protein